MRIATWNLNRPPRSGARREALREWMREIDADVWVLTESREDLAPGDDFDLIAATVEAPDRGVGERWTLIWSRLPGAACIDTADPERAACARIRATESNDLFVYGTVLPWLSDSRRDPLRGSEAFGHALEHQLQDWKNLRHADPGALLCVAGDFNQDLAARHYYGSARGRDLLTAALEAARLRSWTAGSLDPVRRYQGRASIDHICLDVDRAPKEQAHAWPPLDDLGTRLTDHFGVWIDLW